MERIDSLSEDQVIAPEAVLFDNDLPDCNVLGLGWREYVDETVLQDAIQRQTRQAKITSNLIRRTTLFPANGL
jgi:hypothetical protein